MLPLRIAVTSGGKNGKSIPSKQKPEASRCSSFCNIDFKPKLVRRHMEEYYILIKEKFIKC